MSDLAAWHIEQLAEILEDRKDHNRPTVVTTRFRTSRDLLAALTGSSSSRQSTPAKLIRLLEGRHIALQAKK